MMKQFGSPSPFPSLDNTEAGVLDGVVPGTAAVSKALVLDANGDYAGSRNETVSGNRNTTGGVGAVTTAGTTVAEEHGDAIEHLTKLTMTAFAVGTIADNASLGIGAKFYTFPAGAHEVMSMAMVGALTGAVSVTAQTPEVGVGSVIASGAVSVLSGTATFEEYIDGNASGSGGDTVAPDLAAGAFYKNGAFTAPILIKTSGGKSHDLFLNAAAAWADVAATGALTFTGVITIKWRKIS